MAKRKAYSTFSGTADVDVYHDEIVEDIDDATLIAELQRRNKQPPINDTEEVLHLLYRGRAQEAIVYLERMLLPSRAPSPATYEKAKLNRDPSTGHPVIA